jgi:hypothetical protein
VEALNASLTTALRVLVNMTLYINVMFHIILIWSCLVFMTSQVRCVCMTKDLSPNGTNGQVSGYQIQTFFWCKILQFFFRILLTDVLKTMVKEVIRAY